MGMNKAKGNMYGFVSHTWNTVKGKCSHDCSYCYCKAIAHRFNKPQRETFFDEKELKTNLDKGNFIFVGSSNDMFAKDIPEVWIKQTLKHMEKFDNKYLLQTKNPERVMQYIDACVISDKCVVCATIESDAFYPDIMRNSPEPMQRSIAIQNLSEVIDTYVTIEPVLKFNLQHFVKMIKCCNPKQVNIGANSGNIKLPEPSKEEVLQLIEELSKFTKVHLKPNLNRLIK